MRLPMRYCCHRVINVSYISTIDSKNSQNASIFYGHFRREISNRSWCLKISNKVSMVNFGEFLIAEATIKQCYQMCLSLKGQKLVEKAKIQI